MRGLSTPVYAVFAIQAQRPRELLKLASHRDDLRRINFFGRELLVVKIDIHD